MPPPALINMTVSLSHQIRIFHNKRTTPKTYKGIPQNPLVKSTCFHFCKISSASLGHGLIFSGASKPHEKTVPHLLSVDHPSAIRTGANPSVWADPLGQKPLGFFSCTTFCVSEIRMHHLVGCCWPTYFFFVSCCLFAIVNTCHICQLWSMKGSQYLIIMIWYSSCFLPLHYPPSE